VYFEWGSQPSRAVLYLLDMAKIPHTRCVIRLGKAEHLTEEFEKVNPLKQVPAITELLPGDSESFKLGESHAILRYLCESTPGIADHWYPKDPIKRARVDEYLDWHHTTTRQGIGMYIAKSINLPLLFKKHFDPETISYAEFVMKRTLLLMDRWLSMQKYLCGDEMTIADLSATAEFTM
jgi:glutathione S-transferase